MSKHTLITRRAQAGVTLVEVLVVLALLGVMTGAVAFGFGRAANTTTADGEADLLAARLNRAADEIVLTATPMRFEWREDQYWFEVADGAVDWRSHPVTVLADVHVLPDQIGIRSDAEDNNIVVNADLVPASRQAVMLTFSSGTGPEVNVRFDGVNATVVDDNL